MNEFVAWWLGIEAVGLAAFPLTFIFFRALRDRGFAFSKVIGLLLLGYGLWMGATLGVFTNSRGSVILLVFLIGALSLLVVGRCRNEVAAYVRSCWRYMLLVESMFLLVLVAAVFLRSFAPEINSGEKPFELAFLNAISRTHSFPPPDPWLAGESISYYYFGYVIVSALTKLTALDTSVTFFFGLSLMAALTWVAAFGLVYNLILASHGRRADEPSPGPPLVLRAMIFPLAGAALMLLVSNLEGVFELLARHGVGSGQLYDRLGIYGLPGPYDCATAPGDCAEWYPTRPIWWWWATRMGSNFDIQEFPFFSLHFGDLHAHVMAMPLLITLFALCFQLVSQSEEKLGPLSVVRSPGRFALIALLLGGIAFTDAWTIPLAVTLIAASVLIATWLRRERRLRRAVLRSAAFVLPLVATAFLLYLPYYLDLEAERDGIGIIHAAQTTDIPPPNSEVTRPLHFLLFWGPLLWVSLSFIALYIVRRRRELLNSGRVAFAISTWTIPLALWACLIIFGDGFGAFRDELQERGANLLTLALLALAITGAALAFLHALRRARSEDDKSDLFAFLLAGFALLMLLGAELYFVKDFLGWRGNTVFRFWHESWLLLSIAGGFGLYRLTAKWRMLEPVLCAFSWRSLVAGGVLIGAAYTLLVALDPWDTLYSRWWAATPGLLLCAASLFGFAADSAIRRASFRVISRRLVWLVATTVILTAALVYPVLVAFDRTGGFRNSQTVNGLNFVHEQDPAEYQAIQWLNDNVSGTPVILEATGGDFSDSARISSRTGLSTVIGWVVHEVQWRGRPDEAARLDPRDYFIARPQEVERAYATSDVQEARAILEKYNVEYVYIGDLERRNYGAEVLAKFGEFMTPVFQNESVTIYRMPRPPVMLGGDSR